MCVESELSPEVDWCLDRWMLVGPATLLAAEGSGDYGVGACADL